VVCAKIYGIRTIGPIFEKQCEKRLPEILIPIA
jgi:hypothetical protein